jgi:hypothetical protein
MSSLGVNAFLNISLQGQMNIAQTNDDGVQTSLQEVQTPENASISYQGLCEEGVSVYYDANISIYSVKVFVNLTINATGILHLVLKFYSYSGEYEANRTVAWILTPANLLLHTSVAHPFKKPVEVAVLASIEENGTNADVTAFLMTKSDLMKRADEIDRLWALGYGNADLFKELADIDALWPYAPPAPRNEYATSLEWLLNSTQRIDLNISVTYLPTNATEYFYIVLENNETTTNSVSMETSSETVCWRIRSINGVTTNSSWSRLEKWGRPPYPWWIYVGGSVTVIHSHLDAADAINQITLLAAITAVLAALGPWTGGASGILALYVGARAYGMNTIYSTDKNGDKSLDMWMPIDWYNIALLVSGSCIYLATPHYWWRYGWWAWIIRTR